MQISTKLFNEQQVRQFGKLNENIQGLQERVASGNNIIRASDDPVAAVRLSAARDQKQILERFQNNAQTAQSRLELGDQTLQQSINVITRIAELTTQAGNGIYDGFSIDAILTEIDQLSETVLDLANTRDSQGQSLFSGFNTANVAFVKEPNGSVSYNGDRGVHALQISENMNVETSVDGGSVFMRVPTANGPKGIFDVITEVKNAVRSTGPLSVAGNAQANARLNFVLPEKPQNWSFTLAGSTGTVDVETTVESGNLQKVVDDINAHAPATGVTASIDADSKTIVLRDSEAGNISISGIQIKGQDGADSEVLSKLEFTPIDESGKSVGNTRSLADVDQLLGTNLENMRSAMDHLSLQQTRLGAYGSKVAIQIEALTNRTMVITKDISKINDADLAQLVTTLQAQLTNRDAAQQAFAKIGQQSLFDFIR
jgi:flagellar hook-associated protein 3 FlgL